jgi:hypothetical protein
MAKFPTFPTLYDDVLQIRLSKLKELGYLNPNQYKSGTLTWSTNGQERGSILIAVGNQIEKPYVELKYQFKKEPRNYKVKLVSVPSNLGKGNVWYFVCPHTKKRCRVLYSIGGYFLHREAFNGCMYESQTKSKHWRSLEKNFGAAFRTGEVYDELYSKYFKSHYRGKPTKRFKKLKAELDKAENIDIREFERLLITGK